MSATLAELPTRAALDGVPWVDVAASLRAAVLSGRNLAGLVREILAVGRGPGQLTVAEYCYYGLWRSHAALEEKCRFAGKRVQRAMHLACNDYAWNGATEDKLVFHAIATSAELPVPELLAIAHPHRRVTGVSSVTSVDALSSLLRDPAFYPFFAKPIDGMYSLGAVSADRVDAHGHVHLADGSTKSTGELASSLFAYSRGILIQRRLVPAEDLKSRFGNRLCSVRMVTLLSSDGAKVARAVCRIPAPGNIADNFWRTGNIVGAVEPETGMILRSVRGVGEATEINPQHRNGSPTNGFALPDWRRSIDLVQQAALQYPGVRTQSWDIALTDRGPVLLEVNWGGDLNLAQLAYGEGVMDNVFAAHLAACGYDSRKASLRARRLGEALRRD